MSIPRPPRSDKKRPDSVATKYNSTKQSPSSDELSKFLWKQKRIYKKPPVLTPRAEKMRKKRVYKKWTEDNKERLKEYRREWMREHRTKKKLENEKR